MKYIRWMFFLMVVAAVELPLLAQSSYVASTSVAAASRSTESDATDPVLTIKKRVDEVNVLFIATDRHGKFVRNLNQGDFSILDDHKPPQSISNFRRDTDLPIVLGFNGHSQIAQDFTDNVQLLEAGVHGLQNGGGTALYDAIYRASRDKLLKDKSDRPVRHAIVILSDGEDNQSDVSRAQAIEMAQRAEVIIYAISTDDSGLILRGDKVLQQLADATGGRAFFPFKTKDIKSSFSAIEDELRSQYVVSYRPANFDADGRYRSIEIIALKKDLQVRARKGYYAPRQ